MTCGYRFSTFEVPADIEGNKDVAYIAPLSPHQAEILKGVLVALDVTLLRFSS